MPRYIDADKLLEYLEKAAESEDVKYSVIGAGVQAAISVIKTFPMADVAPVIHAHWETDKHAALDFCSSCGEAVERYVTAEQMDKSNYKGTTYWNYCPHCGAKMDEEVDDG